MWKTFFTPLAAVALGGGGLGYYFRDRWTHRLHVELEKFRTSLAADLFERQIKYAWLHPERAKTLVKLYPLLSEAERYCTEFLVVRKWVMIGRVLPSEDDLEKYGNARRVVEALCGLITTNGALLDRGLAEQLGVLVGKYEGFLETRISSELPRKSGLLPTEYVENLIRDSHAISLRNEIQEAVQKMLGVE